MLGMFPLDRILASETDGGHLRVAAASVNFAEGRAGRAKMSGLDLPPRGVIRPRGTAGVAMEFARYFCWLPHETAGILRWK